MTKSLEIIETLAQGYSSDSAQQEISNEYLHDRVKMTYAFLCIGRK